MPVNQVIYRFYAPIYDLAFSWIFREPRRRVIKLLDLQPGERLLISGVGTGLDLPFIRQDVRVTGLDISPEMLNRAIGKPAPQETSLQLMDAQALQFPDGSFDAILLNLVLSVVPDGRAAFQEAWRVLRAGGRLAIFDKFLPENRHLTFGQRFLGRLVSLLGTDPNRRLSRIISQPTGIDIVRNEPSLLGGRYRIVLICKENQSVKINYEG